MIEQNVVLSASAFDPQSMQLVDIREADEIALDPLLESPYVHMPLSTFDENQLDPKKLYLFFCRSGKRSLTLVTRLRKQGYDNTFSLLNGIAALRA